MSDEIKKKVALGTTLALLLGAGSYGLLAFGGKSDSDGLNSGPAGPKVARVSRSDDSGEKVDRPRPPSNRGGLSSRKVQRDHRVVRERDDKTRRPQHDKKITRKKTRKPQA